MHICHRNEIAALIERGDLTLECNSGQDILFLDEHRIGLRLDRVLEVFGVVDLAEPQLAQTRTVDIDTEDLLPYRLYLAVSAEQLSLPPGFAASVHTRSKYARIGFEALGSSNFVVPGFGTTAPCPIVLEISARLRTVNLDCSTAYCFMLICKLAEPRMTDNKHDYHRRFPIILHGRQRKASPVISAVRDPTDRPG